MKKKRISDRGLTPRQLIGSVPGYVHHNGQYVAVAKARKKVDRTGTVTFETQTRTSEVGEKPRKHMQIITILGGGSRITDRGVRVKVQCDCLTASNYIHTDSGLKQIKDLIDPNFQPEDGYTTELPVGGTLYPATPFYSKGKQKVKQVTLSNGLRLTGTGKHPVKVQIKKSRGYDYIWKYIKELDVGDRVVLETESVSIQPDSYETNEWYTGYVLGLFVGDGTFFSDGRPDLRLYQHKQVCAGAAINSSLVKHTQLEGQDSKHPYTRVVFADTWKYTFKRYGISRQHKTLTKEIMANKVVLLGFLSGILDTDGTITQGGKLINFHSVDKLFMRRLQLALGYFGVSNPKLIKAREAGTTEIKGVACNAKALYMMTVSSHSVLRLLDITRLQNPNHLAKIESARDLPRRLMPPVSTVKSVRNKGKKQVYDCTVDTVHSFIANGIVVHNCEYHMYTCEVALYRYGAADIIYSNGMYPWTTNPKGIPTICKHAYIVLKKLMATRQ